MKIYGDVISPFVRFCLVAGHELGLGAKLELVKAQVKPVEVNTDLQKIYPLAKIPVLMTDHNHAIYDSRVIVEYLAHVAGRSDFIPDDGVKRFRMLTLLALAQGVAESAVALRYEVAQRPEAKRWPEFQARLEARILAALDDVEANWQSDLTPVNAATVSLATALGYIDFRHPTLNWREGRPKTTAFVATFNERASMKAWPLAA